MVELPYGRAPYQLRLTGRPATVLTAPRLPSPVPLRVLLDAALTTPRDRPPLEALVKPGDRVTVIVSDPTRDEPRAEFLAAIRDRLTAVRWTIAIATGTHGPCDLGALGIPQAMLQGATIVNHDGHQRADLVELGVTARGTPIRVHRCVLDADVVLPTGCIRPHYFAGFGAGIKAVIPGLGHAPAIRINHALKAAPGARAGIVDGNPCREDLEEAVRVIATPMFLINGIVAADGLIHDVVAGDPWTAFRSGADRARPWFTVRSPRAACVIASDAPPISSSLYQAAKIAAAAAPAVQPGGALVVVAECADGTGPIEVVNEAIVRIGVLPRLAPGATLHLVSGLSRAVVEGTLLAYAGSVEEILDRIQGPVVVIPRASQLIIEASS